MEILQVTCAMREEAAIVADYEFVDLTQVRELVAQVTALNLAAFAEYEGAPDLDESFTEWYLRRPGSTPQLCVGALHGDQLVSMVLITIQRVQIGGRLLDCGIIDSVATDPAHRRQGLARKLMDMAHEKMQAAGAAAGLLYTNPEDHPYRFYKQLGYRTRAVCQMMQAPRPARGGSLHVRAAQATEHETLAAIINDFYGAHDGFAPLDEELWEWHKVGRPADMRAEVRVAEAGGELVGTCTWAQTSLLLEGEDVPVAALADFACRPELCDGADVLRSLLAAAPQQTMVCLLDENDPLLALYAEAGFEKAVSEASMVLPFSDDAHEAMAVKPGPWYVMVESVIGM